MEIRARAYIGLLKCGPGTAYEVAEAPGLPRANVYTILKTLAEKGVVGLLVKSRYNICLSALKQNFKGFPSRPLSFARVLRRLQTSEKHVWIKGTDNYIKLLLPEIKKACNRGISIIIILISESVESVECHENCRVVLHEDNGVVIGGSAHYITVTADGNKALIAQVIGAMEAAYSENYPFTYALDVMIKHEIYMAEIIHHFKDEIETEFGPGLSKLREIYSSAPPSAPFDEYVKKRMAELKKR